MSEVGALIVKLQAETAQFREDMGKVKSDLDDLKGKSGEAGEGIKTSMTEARGGLMLVEESIGVKLPRHLNTLIAQIPGVGSAFAMMLPIAGVLVAIEVVGKLIDHHAALAAAIHKAADEANNQAIKEADQTKALEVTNMKLDDQIAKLEHKPAKNYMAEAIMETSQEIDKLAASFAADFAKMNDVIEQHLDWWTELKSTAKGFFTEGAAGAVSSTIIQNAALEDLRTKMMGVEQARRAMAEVPDNGDRNVAQQHLLATLKAQLGAFDGARGAYIGNTEMMLKFSSAASSTANEIKDLNLALQAGGKKEKIAGLEQAKENLLPLQEQADLQKIITAGTLAEQQAQVKLNQSKAEMAIASTKGGEDSSIDEKLKAQMAALESEKTAIADAAQNELVAKAAFYEADIKAAGGNAAKKREINAQYSNDVNAILNEVAEKNASVDVQMVAADRSAANQRAEIAKALAQQVADDALKGSLEEAAAEQKKMEEFLKIDEAAHHRSLSQRTQAAIEVGNAEIAAEKKAYTARLAALDKFDKDYAKKAQELKDKIVQIEQKGDNEVTALNNAALLKQLNDVKSAQDKMADAIAGDIAKSIVQNKSLAQAFRQTGEQMAEQMIKNLLIAEMTGDKSKLISAEKAASDSYAWATPWGGPIAGAVAAAAAFAGVMSFEVGGKIPGEGPVPITGHGGETVVTKALTDRVESSERNRSNAGGGGGGLNVHFSPQIHAMDAEGVDRVLTKHSSVFQRHIASTVRRMNK